MTNLSVPAPESTEAKNIHHLVMDIFWFGLAFPTTSRFLATYALRVDASAQQIGWLTAAPSLVLLFATLLSNRWRLRYPNATRAVILPGLGHRMVFLLPAFTPLFPHDWQPIWLILSATLPALSQGIASVVFLVMLREAVSIEKITLLISRRNFAFNVALGGSTIALGIWLTKAPFPWNYQIVFLLAFVLALVSLWHVKQTQSVYNMPASAQPISIKSAWRNSDFRAVTQITVLVHLAVFFVPPLIPIYLMDTLGRSEDFVALFSFVELAGAASIAMFMPQITHRIGNARLLPLGMFGMAVSVLMIGFSPAVMPILLGAALGGVFWTMEGVSLFSYFSEKTPSDQVMDYTKMYNQAAFLSMFIAPLLSTQLVEMRVDVVPVLLLGVGIRVVAGWFIRHIGDTTERAEKMKRELVVVGSRR